LAVIDRNALAGQIRYRFDFRAGQENRNQTVSVVRRPSRGLFGVAAHSFRMVGTVGGVSFRFRPWNRCGGGTACGTRIPVLRSLGIGAGSGVTRGLQIRDLCSRHFSGMCCGLFCCPGVRRGLRLFSADRYLAPGYFDELCEDAGCAGVDDTSREETTATPSLT
jgi:hypothetical protein